MSLLQRYILGELLRVFLLLVSVLTLLLVLVGVVKEVVESGLGAAQVLQILPYVIPSMLPYTIPATCLLTVCVVFGRMAADSEIVAAKAAGIHVSSLLWPAFLIGGVLSMSSFFLMDRTIPWAVANIQRTVTHAMEDIFLGVLRSHHQFTDSGQGISITVTDVRGRTLITPIFQYTPRKGRPVTIKAAEATLRFDLKNKVVWLKLKEGHINAPGGRHLRIAEIEEPFPLPRTLATPKIRNQSITYIRQAEVEVAREIETARDRRDAETAFAFATGEYDALFSAEHRAHTATIHNAVRTRRRMATTIHMRIAMAFSCLCFVLVGAPFAIWQGKRQFLSTFFLCYMPILLLYYPAGMLMMNLSKQGVVDPAWAMWVANAGLITLGFGLLRKVTRH